VLNPNLIFGHEPFRRGYARNFAVRYYGHLKVDHAGLYEFAMLTAGGVRMALGDRTLIDVSGGIGPGQTVQESVNLGDGSIPIDVTYFTLRGAGELQLSYRRANGEWQVVTPDMLTPGLGTIDAVTDANGAFTARGIPTHVGPVRVAISHASHGRGGATIVPNPNGVADVGRIVLGQRQ
jgi:hypothetical protein